jgi:hypothetical protein
MVAIPSSIPYRSDGAGPAGFAATSTTNRSRLQAGSQQACPIAT